MTGSLRCAVGLDDEELPPEELDDDPLLTPLTKAPVPGGMEAAPAAPAKTAKDLAKEKLIMKARFL